MDIDLTGCAKHNTCISHCLPYAFRECRLNHPDTCSNCESFFLFFNTLRMNLKENEQEKLPSYQNKLIAFMVHHARKTYLNAQFDAQFAKLDLNEAIIIVDYKMKILPQKARETKNKWFGKQR